MILRRLGNKKKLAKKIQQHFPPHNVYIEPFFGAGGMFFNKPTVKYNIVNDLDSEVYNLYQVLNAQRDALEKRIKQTPVHIDLLNHWKTNTENDPVDKAVRFLFLSNLLMPTTADIKRQSHDSGKKVLLKSLKATIQLLLHTNIRFFNEDFRHFINYIGLRGSARPLQDKSIFIYCDPPYLGTANNYEFGFKEQDSIDLFDCLEAKGCKFAVSEFDHPFILEQAKKRKLNVIIIGERRNLKNRRTEILITNYSKSQPTLF